MPIIEVGRASSDFSLPDLIEHVAKLEKMVDYLINISGIDSENIRTRGIDADRIVAKSLTANEIAAETITANEIAANAITTQELKAGAVTADKISVTELSAISANIGTVNAGSITSQSNINVVTDLRVGQSIYLNASSFESTIYLTPNVYIYFDPGAESLRMVAPGGVYANGIKIDV